MIFEAAASLLREEEPKPVKSTEKPAGKEEKEGSKNKKDEEENDGLSFPKSKIIIKGAPGPGAWKKELNVMESRAISEPNALCRDLGLTYASGNDDLDKAFFILKAAITKNDVMGEAFTGISKIETAVNAKRLHTSGFEVKTTLDKKRDAVKFLYITLLAAERAKLITFDRGVGFSPHDFVSLATVYAL